MILLIPKFLLPNYYVQFNLLFPIASLLASLMLGWFSGAVYRYIHDFLNPDNDRHRQTAFFYYSFVSLVLLVVYGIGSLFISSIFHLIPIFLVAIGLKTGVISVLNAAERHRLFLFANIAFALALGIFIGLCAWTSNDRLAENIAIYAAIDILIASVVWGRLGIFSGISVPRFDPRIGRHCLYYGFPLLASSLAVWGMTLSDRYLLALWEQEEGVAAYILSYQLSGAVITVPMSFLMAVVYPKIIRMDREFGREAALSYSYELLGLYRWAMVGIVPLGSIAVMSIIYFLYPSYDLKPEVVTLIVLAHSIFGLSHFYNKKFELSGRTIMITQAVGIGAVVNIGMNLMMIPSLGVMGAAISALVACSVVSYVAYRGNS